MPIFETGRPSWRTGTRRAALHLDLSEQPDKKRVLQQPGRDVSPSPRVSERLRRYCLCVSPIRRAVLAVLYTRCLLPEHPPQARLPGSVGPHWDHMLDVWYERGGYDRKTGRPRPETLKALGLEGLIPAVWGS